MATKPIIPTALLVLAVVGIVIVVIGFATHLGFFIAHTIGHLDGEHLSESEKQSALAGIYEVDSIETSGDDGVITINGPSKFLGLQNLTIDTVLENLDQNEEIMFIESILAETIFLPNPNTPNIFSTVSNVIQEVIEFCDLVLVGETQDLLDEIGNLLDQHTTVLLTYQAQFTTLQMNYVSRNQTYYIHEAILANYTISCNDTGAVTTYIQTYNDTRIRLDILIANHLQNAGNYSLLLDRYNTLEMNVTTAISGNCTQLVQLSMDLDTLQMNYDAQLLIYNDTKAVCQDCADDFAVLAPLSQQLQDDIDTYLNDSLVIINNANTLETDTNVLETLAGTVRNSSVTLTNELQILESNYTSLNASLAGLKQNAEMLRDLAMDLNTTTSAVSGDTTLLNTTINTVSNVTNTIIENCSAVNSTIVQQYIDELNNAIANITTLLSDTNTALDNLLIIQGNLTDLENRMTDVESLLATLGPAATDAATDFTTLNSTYTTLVAQYTTEQLRYDTLEPLYAPLLDRYNILVTQINNITTQYGPVQTQVATNDGNVTSLEARIAALEPEICPVPALITETNPPVLQSNFTSGADLAKGAPVTFSYDQTYGSTRTLRFLDTKTVLPFSGLTTINSYGNRFHYTAHDPEDYLYTFVNVAPDNPWTVVFNGVTYTVDESTGIIGGTPQCLVAKLSPTRDVVWIAQVGGTENIFCGGITYDRLQDTIWISAGHSRYVFDARTEIEYTRLYDAGLTGYRFEFPKNYSSEGITNCRGIVAQISRSGQWLSATTIEPAFGGPADQDCVIRGGTDGIISNHRGQLLGTFKSRQRNDFDFGGDIALGPLPNPFEIHIIHYVLDVRTTTFIYAGKAQFASDCGAFDTRLAIDIETGEFYYGWNVQRTCAGPYDLSDGSSLTIPLAVGELIRVVVVQLDPANYLPKWVQTVRSSTSGGSFVQLAAIDILQSHVVIALQRRQGNEGMIPLVYGNGPNDVNVDSTFNQLIAAEKATGNFADRYLGELASIEATYYNDRTDSLFVFMSSSGLTTLDTNQELFDMTGRFLFMRFDHNVNNIALVQPGTFFGNLTITASPFQGRYLTVDSHGHVLLAIVAQDEPQNVVGTGEDQMSFQFTGDAVNEDTFYFLTFSQEEQFPLGVLSDDILEGNVGNMCIHGQCVMSGFFDNVADVGKMYHLDASNKLSITAQEAEQRGQAQIGYKTLAVDEFLVDIHGVPLIGSDQ